MEKYFSKLGWILRFPRTHPGAQETKIVPIKNAQESLAKGIVDPKAFLPIAIEMKIVQTKKRSSKLGKGLDFPQSSALKIVQTKKRSSKLGVFSY
ncbi:hypothetical protein [uncultured Gelidibacter sp.]|uniref:hypothetical protein n=1 Tax=uncultured Gelidibacter sp. TaxID=259318 RepID=UPI00261AC1F3|nr:hypothetical protein [uncultured Gelidibacter sp.]